MSANFKLPSRSPAAPPTGSSSAGQAPQLSPPTASSAQALINQLFSENEAVRAENASLKKSMEDLKSQLHQAHQAAQSAESLKNELENANMNIQQLQNEIESQVQQVIQAQQAAQQAAAAAAAAAAAFATPQTRPAAASTSSLQMGMNRQAMPNSQPNDTRGASASISKFPFKQGVGAVPPPAEAPKAVEAPQQAQPEQNGASVGMARAMSRRKSRAQIQQAADGDMAGKDTVTALYDYSAMRTEEVSFKEGDVFVVTEKDASGWWRGIVRGQEGLFPSNYTKPN